MRFEGHMRTSLTMQVEFVNATQAAIGVSFESPPTSPDFSMLVLLSVFALRQFSNIGASHPVSRSLASALGSLKDPNGPIITLLGPPDISLQSLRDSMREGAPDPMKNFVSVDTVELLPYGNQRGLKRFLAALSHDAERALLRLDVKGFDKMGRGINYFAPLSVALLIRRLAALQSEHAGYGQALVEVANLAGAAALSDTITFTNQPFLAAQIASHAARSNAIPF
jgi:hypothetical protein